MITLEELRANKLFREYKNNPPIYSCDLFFQTNIRDNCRKIKYSVNIRYWDWTKYPGYDKNVPFGLDTEISLYAKDSRALLIEFSIQKDDTIQSILDRAEDMYKKLECIPDIYSND